MIKYKILRFLHLISKNKFKKETAKYTKEYRLIATSNLFDKDWYLEQNPDVKDSGIDPITHYLKYGWIEGRNPSVNFDTKAYLKYNADVRALNINPLVHYEISGKMEKRSPLGKKHKKIIIPQTKKIKTSVIYTCITGGYDSVVEHTCINKNFDYVLFTDNSELLAKKKIGIWEIRPLVFNKLDNVKNARWHKTHPHTLFPKYKYSIWIDGNIDVLSKSLFEKFNEFISQNETIFAYRHAFRDCIYDEAETVCLLKKDYPRNVKKIVKILESEKYPRHLGLCETGVIIRSHRKKKCITAMEKWWNMIELYSRRDQLSFNYILWKNKNLFFTHLKEEETLRNCDNFEIKKSESHNSATVLQQPIKSISIIIPIYNALDDVKNLFNSIIHVKFSHEVEIILIDDCSREDTAKFLDKHVTKDKRFRLLRNKENLGFVKSCNRGLREAKGDVVILLNSDTMLPKAFEKKIIYCFDRDKSIGVASPISSDTGLWKIDVPEGLSITQMDAVVEKVSQKKFPDILCPEGFCFCIRKEVIQQIGYLDEIFGIGYCEETDYAFRAMDSGWRACLIDNLFVYHKHHASFGAETRKKQIDKNKEILWSRWKPLYDKKREKIDMNKIINEIKDKIIKELQQLELEKESSTVCPNKG